MWRLLHARERGEYHTHGRSGAEALLEKRTLAGSPGVYARLAMDAVLHGHRGCVNHISFNDSGSLLASGSDDTRLLLWDVAQRRQRAAFITGHTFNIFCARYGRYSRVYPGSAWLYGHGCSHLGVRWCRNHGGACKLDEQSRSEAGTCCH